MNRPFSKFRALTLALALSVPLSSVVMAQTAPPPAPAVKKLPPVNYIRSRNVDIKHVAIDLRFDWAKEQAFGNTIVTLAPFKATDKINLDAAQMQISAVSIGGKPVKFNYAGGEADDNLEITLDRVYKSGEDVSVKIEYRTSYVNSADADTAIGSFGRGIRFIKPTDDNPLKPRQIWSQGETEFNRYWFPSYDAPNDFRTSELRATVEKPYMVVSNGKLMETKDNGDNTRTFYWKMDVPYSNYLTSIVVGEYTEVKNGDYQGIPVMAFGYPSEAKEVAATTKNIVDMVKFFSERTGVKYAYPKYSQTMVEDFGGGMENISATTQIEEMIHDEREMLDEDSDSLQSHELAHQWFGDYVTTRDWTQIWLNESFATYFDALYNEYKKGHEDFLFENVRANQNQYYATWNAGNRRPIVTKYYENKDAIFDAYVYPRGAAVLHMLRKHLGDELFFKSINHYLTQNAHQPVSTEDLRIAFEETTGQSMDWFFDEWIFKMGHPVFEVTKSYDAAAKKLTLNVKQTQKTDPNNEYPQVQFFQTSVDVEIDGNVQRVWIKPQAENVFTFDAATEPKLVNFDYEGTLIKELKFEKSTDELVYQLQNDKDPLGRRWAMSELAKKAATDKEKVLAALRNTVETDKVYQLRRAALAEIRNAVIPRRTNPMAEDKPVVIDAATIATLQKAAKDQKSLVRADAIGLLGATGDVKYADLYLAALNDQSYTVIDRAAESLAVTKSPKAYDALSKLAGTASWRDRIKIAGFNGLAELEDKRAFDAAYKVATDKNASPNLRTTALSVIGATGKGNPQAFPLIFEQFKKSLDANAYQAIFNGASALINLADPRGQQAFDLMREKFKNQANLLNYVNIFETRFKAAVAK